MHAPCGRPCRRLSAQTPRCPLHQGGRFMLPALLRVRTIAVRMFPAVCLVALGLVASSMAFAQSQRALQLDGSTQYVTFGKAYPLQASSFTVEIRFKRTGAGVTTSTSGTGGWTNIVPLLTKGRAELDTPDSLNINYFLGIRSDGRLARSE